MEPNKPTSKEALAELAQALSQGSVEAFSTIYRLYFNRLFRYARQISGQPELAEDVVQDFFAYLAENSRKLRKVTNLEVYLFQSIKRNLFARLSRKKQKQQSRDRWLQLAAAGPKVVDPPDLSIIAGEDMTRRQHLIQGEMAKLPGHQREILYLRYYENLSYEEICQILGLGNQVARNYASRAIRQLKKALLNKEWLFSIMLLFS